MKKAILPLVSASAVAATFSGSGTLGVHDVEFGQFQDGTNIMKISEVDRALVLVDGATYVFEEGSLVACDSGVAENMEDLLRGSEPNFLDLSSDSIVFEEGRAPNDSLLEYIPTAVQCSLVNAPLIEAGIGTEDEDDDDRRHLMASGLTGMSKIREKMGNMAQDPEQAAHLEIHPNADKGGGRNLLQTKFSGNINAYDIAQLAERAGYDECEETRQFTCIEKIEESNTEGFLFKHKNSNVCVVAYAGSNDMADWIQNLIYGFARTRASLTCGMQFHEGFYKHYKQSEKRVKQLLVQNGCYDKDRVIFTGHSLGGSAAIIADQCLFEGDATSVVFASPITMAEGAQPITDYRIFDEEDPVCSQMCGVLQNGWGIGGGLGHSSILTKKIVTKRHTHYVEKCYKKWERNGWWWRKVWKSCETYTYADEVKPVRSDAHSGFCPDLSKFGTHYLHFIEDHVHR